MRGTVLEVGMVAVALVVVIGILVLVGYVVHRARPTRFKLNAGVWKILTLNVEVDSGPEPGKPPEEVARALPEPEQGALPSGGEQKALPTGGGSDDLRDLPGKHQAQPFLSSAAA